MGNKATAEAIPTTVVGGILAYKEPKAFMSFMEIALIVGAVLFVIMLVAMMWLSSKYSVKAVKPFALITSPMAEQQSNAPST